MPSREKKYEKPMHDGRRKLSPELHPEIVAKYATGNYSWRSLAREYDVTKGTIAMIVSEKYRERVKNYNKGRWKIYADKDRHREAIRKYRAKKRRLKLVYNPNPVLPTEKICEYCGKKFIGIKKQKYCDSKHRYQVYKDRHK